jgi:hypothetical protein
MVLTRSGVIVRTTIVKANLSQFCINRSCIQKKSFKINKGTIIIIKKKEKNKGTIIIIIKKEKKMSEIGRSTRICYLHC